MAPRSVRLCHLDDLPDGDSRGFDPFRAGQDTLLVVRQGRELYAWLNSCPHIGGTPMAWRKDAFLNAARDRIVCAAHGALFDIVSGRCDLGPCLGQTLTPLRVMLAADDAVYLEFDATTAKALAAP
jgi:nitrite reductase/ring-hydroxylating ferredoxin subunit